MPKRYLQEARRHLPEAMSWVRRLEGQPSTETWGDFHAWLSVGPSRLVALVLTDADLSELAEREVRAGLEPPFLALLLKVCVELINRTDADRGSEDWRTPPPQVIRTH